MPDREDIVAMVAAQMFGSRILNNSHRGEVVEMMVLAALGDDWEHVGLGWHPWDLQHGSAADRVRIQVKQTAAVQLWGNTKKRTLTFGWKTNPPGYFERDNPQEFIEPEGWFCDIFVFGIHDETDRDLIDQAAPEQWMFLVIPVSDLQPKTNSMQLRKARSLWNEVTWNQLSGEVHKQIERLRGTE